MFIRQWVAGALILLSMATVAQHQPYQDIKLKQFPDLQPRTLSSIDNKKPTYLKFWASWCKNCLVMDRTTLADPAVVNRLKDMYEEKEG